MPYFDEWLVLVTLHTLALMAPGPDFVMAIRNSIVYSRTAGFFTAIGFSLGVAVHMIYCTLGIAALIAQSVMLFSIIKYIGAGYLIYLGITALRSGNSREKLNGDLKPGDQTMSNLSALRSGFITNLFNPKATMYFLALFTQIIDINTPPSVLVIYGATCVILTILWFSLVAFVLTTPHIKARFLDMTKWLDKVFGGLLILLGLKIATNKGLTP